MALSWFDWLIIFVPLAVVVVIGVISERYIRGVSDFLAAGRKAGRYLLSVADGTAAMGLISMVAIFEQNYKCGFALGFWQKLSVLVGLTMTLTGFVTYRFRETRSLTMAEFFQRRYSRGFRILAGSLAFISGLLNYALFPAVGGRFIIYYCQLPFTVNIFGLQVSTYGLLMALFLGTALVIVLSGGQITTMITDCCQGLFAYAGYAIIVVTLLYLFKADDVQNAVMSRPEGMSFFNPFNVDKLTTFNLLYIIIAMFSGVYNRGAWLGSQAYMCSAASPHEQKMAGVLGQWRTGFTYIAIMLLTICAYTYMNAKTTGENPQHRFNAAAVNSELDARVAQEFHLADYTVEERESTSYIQAQKSAATIRNQMLVPVALRHILPVGVTGILCALMLFLMVSTDTTYLHSWGTILIQDVVLPIRNRPISPKAQMTLLRCSIVGIAVFAWFFSMYFQQGDFILQFFALTGTIFLGGAGSCIIGGLYWRRGTTAGAYTAMIVGSIFAVCGFLLNQKWGSWIYPWLNDSFPQQLETFRRCLESLGNALPVVQWETAPAKFAITFPITSQEMYFLGILSALSCYVVVSLLTCREKYNLERLLHRGEYNLEHFVAATAKQEDVAAAGEAGKGGKKRFNMGMLAGITPEYSRGDRILAWSVVIWTLYHFSVFLVQVFWNINPAWRWSELTWFRFWLYYTLPLDLTVAMVTTVWFSWGSSRDLRRMLVSLRQDSQVNSDDNGQVITGKNADK